MIFHPNMAVWIVAAAVFGAAYMADRFRRDGRPVPLGAMLGSAAAVAGALIPMVPLRSCTFESGRSQTDFTFGLILFFAVAAGLVIGAERAVRHLGDRDRVSLADQEQASKMFKTTQLVPWALLAPSLLVLSVFIYWPAIRTARLSLLRFRLGSPRTPFVCVDNFTELIDPHFSFQFFMLVGVTAVVGATIGFLRNARQVKTGLYRRAVVAWKVLLLLAAIVFFLQVAEEEYGETLFATVFISGGIVVFTLVIGLAIAYLAFQPVRGIRVYRTLLIWPYAVSAPIAGILFFVIFDPSTGIVDHFLNSVFGFRLPNYRTDVWQARAVVIAASVWKLLGYNVLFFLAGLQTVSVSTLEAATLDGANAWQRFRYVTLPALAPIRFFLVITNLTFSFFDLFGTVDTLTKGAPAGATSVAIYGIYNVGIQLKFLGRAAAQALVLFAIVIIVTIWQFRLTARRGASVGPRA